MCRLWAGGFGPQGENLEVMISSGAVSELVTEGMSAVMPGEGHTWD